jgi:hypothetical protein
MLYLEIAQVTQIVLMAQHFRQLNPLATPEQPGTRHERAGSQEQAGFSEVVGNCEDAPEQLKTQTGHMTAVPSCDEDCKATTTDHKGLTKQRLSRLDQS